VGRGAAFDTLAPDYDASFTVTPLGTLLRQAVWRRLDASFAPGQRVLELGCGTGEDAVHLASHGVRVLATDASPVMVETARRKVAAAGLGEMVDARRMGMEEVGTLAGTFDGAFSDFGGLNCVADLGGIAQGLAALLPPGAPVLLCVMGPLVPWEWIWYLSKLQPGKAFRRLRPGGVAWRGITVRYPSIRTLRRAFAPAFRLRRVSGVGAFLPPTYVEGWTRRHPRALSLLERWEGRLAAVAPFPWLADHYLAELVRS
jgi:SAM-dependent methyltransferase